jgi:hypothetical protein
MYPVTSRYHGIETLRFTTPDGREIVYLKRRFLPPLGKFGVLAEYNVKQNERLDHITARYLGDPEQFWRVCDANPFLHPEELTGEIGYAITIPSSTPGD